jgi:flagellar basal-body rod protein FlgB
MELPGDRLLNLAERRIGWLESRQRVLAQNIANADTPGYQPSDLRSFAALLAGGPGVALARTSPGHIAPAAGEAGVRRDRTVGERTPDGNAVSLDQQALKVAETDSAHALALNLYRRYAALYRTALGRNG